MMPDYNSVDQLPPDFVPGVALPSQTTTLPPDVQGAPTVWQGSVLPISKDAAGNAHFDPSAGFLGGIFNTFASAVTAPADALAGRISPNDPMGATRRAMDFASMFSPKSPALGAGEMIPGEVSTTAGAPSAQQLKNAAAAGYDAARASTATVPGGDIAAMAQQLQQTLQNDHGVIAKTAPKTYAILDELSNPQPGAYGTYPGLEAARRGLSAVASEGGTDGFAAQKAIPQLNQFIDAISPEAADARANYAAAQRSNDLTGALDRANTGILERAEARAHAAHSGTNLDNSIRQRIASFLQNPQNLTGYSQPEIDALNDLVRGSVTQNAARRVGNFFGGGGGLGGLAATAAGAALGNHLMPGGEGIAIGSVVPTAIGMSAKTLENSLARRNLNAVDEMVRQNSPLYRAMQIEGILRQPAMGANDAVLRSILPGLIAPAAPMSLAPMVYTGNGPLA